MTERRKANPLAGDSSEAARLEVARLVQAAQDQLQAALDEGGLEESDLARRLGVGPEDVERLLDSTEVGIDELVVAGLALGVAFDLVRRKG